LKSDKGQSFILIGIGLFMLGIVVLYIGLSQPKIVVNNNDNTSYASQNAQNTNVDENITYFQNNSENNNNNAFVSEKQFAYPVNLNTATVEDLMSVEGIGENRAWQIVSYRNEIGKYTSVAQIKNISGIGDGVYEQISPYLTV